MMSDFTEVERAFLIHFQKWFLNKVFIRIKIVKKFKFYAGMVTSGSKSVKKCQKMLKKATIWTYIWFFWNFLALANLKHINSCIMQKNISFGVFFHTWWYKSVIFYFTTQSYPDIQKTKVASFYLVFYVVKVQKIQ